MLPLLYLLIVKNKQKKLEKFGNQVLLQKVFTIFVKITTSLILLTENIMACWMEMTQLVGRLMKKNQDLSNIKIMRSLKLMPGVKDQASFNNQQFQIILIYQNLMKTLLNLFILLQKQLNQLSLIEKLFMEILILYMFQQINY